MREILPVDKSVLVFVYIKNTDTSLQTKMFFQYGNKFFGGTERNVLRNIEADNQITPDRLVTLPDGSCICKEWPMSAYEPIKDRCNFVTVLRDPVSRIIDSYNVFRASDKQCSVTIDEYLRNPLNVNVYQRMLSPFEWISEIYLSENMKASTKHSKIIHVREMPRIKKRRYRFEFTEAQKKDVERLNAEDMAIYERIRRSHGI